MKRGNSDNVPIADYLRSVATGDIQGGHIRPQSDVEARIAEEIEQRTGCSHTSLGPEANEFQRVALSAEPEKFVGGTLTAIETICAALKRERATKFDLRFANPDNHPNWWGDQILVAVRYCA
jgi:hypothetical protein